MQKLKLRLDDLRVDTFDTTSVQKEKGTVFGEQCTCNTACTCPGCPTCASCNGTCDYSCNGTCVETCGDSCWGTCNEPTCGWTCAASCAGSCRPPDTCYYTCDQGMTCYGAIC